MNCPNKICDEINIEPKITDYGSSIIIEVNCPKCERKYEGYFHATEDFEFIDAIEP